MKDNHSNTKRIFKNTIVLYFRMIVTLLITLYTSRIVLKALGFDDYGLYNVVGGVVALFAFLKSSMSSSTQRFLSYEMGKNDGNNLRNVFSVCFSTHLLLAGILLLIAETIGLWFLNTQINIPEGREQVANIIYQFSVASLCFNMISIPYDADIVSNERMGYFAFVSIFDALLKLAIAFVILNCQSDRLVLYAFLMMCISIVNLALNWVFCRVKFQETHYKFYWDKSMFKKVFSFSGWTIWGQLAIIGSNQGTNILVNIFHSVTANAAMGVGHQVNTALTGLISNFQTAFKPQITKSYASGDFDYLQTLTYYASKISFFILFIVSMPVIFNIDWILDVWLDKVPQYANDLCVVFIVASLCNAVSAPLWMNIFATGNIKSYQIAMSVAYVVELVVVYALFKLGVPIVVGVSMKAVLNFIVIFIRVIYAHKVVESFSMTGYLKNVVLPVALSAFATLLIGIPAFSIVDNVLGKIGMSVLIIVASIAFAFLIGLNKSERQSVRNIAKKYIKIKK